jgi:hypothetical protein
MVIAKEIKQKEKSLINSARIRERALPKNFQYLTLTWVYCKISHTAICKTKLHLQISNQKLKIKSQKAKSP